MKCVLYILCILTLTSCSLLRKTSTVSLDSSAEAMIAQGKRLLRSKNYVDAMDKFELAWDRDFHRSSTAALFLSGLSAYYAGYDDIAEQRFGLILEKYPKSRYLEDAKFHLALIKAQDSDISMNVKGLNELLQLNKQSSIPEIKNQSIAHVQDILFERIPLRQLETQFSSTSGELQSYWTEALCYRLLQKNRKDDAQQIYDSHIAKNGKDTKFLQQLFQENQTSNIPTRVEPNIFRIAMVLPFYFNRVQNIYIDEVPKESMRALEFYEGFQLAIDEYASELPKEVYLKTYDTRRDTFQTKIVLKQLDLLQPDIVIGDIYNTQSRIISDWAETHSIPQIIPLSPTEELVKDRDYSFLAHPSVKTHGAQMAEYAWNDLSLTHVSVFTDRSTGTQPLAEGFMETFLSLGGTVDTLVLHPNYEIAIDQIPELVDEVPEFGPESVGVYIPLMNNEESAGLIVNLIKQRSKEVVMMGSPHFRSRYNTLSRDTKESFQLLFTTSHMHDPGNPQYRSLYNIYLEKYKFPPSDNVIQGYDLGRYIMSLVRQNNPPPFSLGTYLKGNPVYKGIHLDYRFDFQQSNQHVNIGQYTEEGLIRVK